MSQSIVYRFSLMTGTKFGQRTRGTVSLKYATEILLAIQTQRKCFFARQAQRVRHVIHENN
jgi:hypothetical protein